MADSVEPADQIALLHELTCALLEAESMRDVARVGLERALPLLGGRTGALYVPDRDRASLEFVAQLGIPPDLFAFFRSIPTASPFPVAIAFRTGEPLWLDDPTRLGTEYPEVATLVASARAR